MLGISDLGRYVSGGCAAVAILAGCGGSGGAQVAPAVPAQQITTRRAFNSVRADSIVYTPVNKTIKDNGSLGLDLNNDATNDFTLTQSLGKYWDPQTGQPCGFHVKLSLSPNQSSNRAASGANFGWAGALRKGRRIDSRFRFITGSALLADVSWNDGHTHCQGAPKNWDYGYWWGSNTRYLGLEFQVQGQLYYGWAEVGMTGGNRSSYDVYTTLTGYAYQTIAGNSIKAGQTK